MMMMRPSLLLFAAFAVQIFAQECKEKKSLNLKDGLKMKCRRGKWIPIEKRSGPSGPPCEDDSSLLAQCSNERGHCQQYTDKGVKMDKDCPGTCGSCDSCRCQDAFQWHAYCPYWAQYCDSPGVLGTWMGDNCRKTCNKCKCGCCSYKGKKHGLGAVIPLAGQCGALVCEEGLVAGPSTLLPGASLHNVSHPEELTLSFKSLFPGSDCCILPSDAEEGGIVLKNQSMVQEGWSGKFNKDGMLVQATCCHGTLSVPLEDAVISPPTTTATADVVITEISVKTNSEGRASSGNDAASITICDKSGDCCSTPLDNPGIADRVRDTTDTYSGSGVLGQCFNFVMGQGDLKVTLEKEGDDGWTIDWAKINLAGGMSFNCPFNIFLDNDGVHSRTATVFCSLTL